jgi:membrane protein DedA with SNARE-associated domain
LKFLIADAFTAVFTIILMVGAGYMGGYSSQVVKRDVTKIEHLVVLLLIISLAIHLLFRYFKSR